MTKHLLQIKPYVISVNENNCAGLLVEPNLNIHLKFWSYENDIKTKKIMFTLFTGVPMATLAVY